MRRKLINRIKERTSWVMYRRIQSICVIYYSLFLLANVNHGLQLATKEVYKAGVHIFIYDYTRS